MATKDLSINIRVNDQASGSIRNVGSSLTGIGTAGSSAAAGLTKMLGPIGLAIASFATLKKGISEVASAVSLFSGFDDTMRKVGAVTKATTTELKAMTETAKLMGATTRYTATQAAEALSFLGMAGFSAADAMEALPDVLNLAAAGGLELGTAADIATNILSGFGLEISQLARVNDVLTETFTNSNTTLGELGEGFKYVGPIAKGVGADFEDLLAAMGKLGDAGIKACYDDKTDVLTLDGWKPWCDVSIEDKFATYNESKNTIEYQSATQLIRYQYSGKMYKVKSRGVDLCVTPEHRMYVQPRGKNDFEILQAKDIVGKTVRYLTGGLEWEGISPKYYRVNGFLQNRGNWDKTIPAKFIDINIWAAFMGWYISEGSCRYEEKSGSYKVIISQKKIDHLEEIHDLLEKMPWRFNYIESDGFVCTSEQLFREVSPLEKQSERRIPSYLKNWETEQLEILFDALIKSDGDSNNIYYTSSTGLKDDVQEIALKVGYATFSNIRKEEGSLIGFDKENREIRTTVDDWKVNVATKNINPWWDKSSYTGIHGERLDGSRHDFFEGWVDYNGEVFCAEVPNHLLIVRRNGLAIVSGNSMAGTTLRGILEALFNPSREEAELMKELAARMGGATLNIKDAKGNFVGFSEVVRQLEKASLSGGEALKLFGARSGPGMAALVEVGADALEELENKLNNVDDTASKISAQMEGGIGGAFRLLTSTAEGLGLQVGESIGTRMIPSIQELVQLLKNLTQEIKNLDESNAIENITTALQKMVTVGAFGVELGVAYYKEFFNTIGIAFNTLTGDLETAGSRIDKVGSSFRKILADRKLIASDQEIQLGIVKKQIEITEREAETIKEKIELDRKDLQGWRAKVLGQKAYTDQLARHNEELQELYQKVWELNRTKLKIETEIKLGDFAKDFVSQVRTVQKESTKIGIGAGTEDEIKFKAKEYAAQYTQMQKDREENFRALKISSEKLLSDLKLQGAELERQYQTNLITVNEYYQQRKELIEKAGDIEIRLLEEQAYKETDATKREKIDVNIYQAKEKLTEDLIKLDIEYYKIRTKFEEDHMKSMADYDQKKLEAAKAYKDIELRIFAGSGGEMEAQFQQELADLQERQNRELQIVNQGLEDQAKLQEFYRMQKIEQDQLEFSQWKRLTESRLQLSKEIAGGMAQSFSDLYELTGEKQKEWFYLAKAAALAETGINTAQGIMKAWAQGGTFGAVGAALVAVQGAIQTAKILSTGLAEGGVVPGSSPNPKADNIMARLTAGEYVQPVDTVKHYGLGVMEALRNKVIPREAFNTIGMKTSSVPRFAFAEGGPVMNGSSMKAIQSQGNEKITIINYTDRQELLSALGTTDGINAVVNVISANREKVSRVLR